MMVPDLENLPWGDLGLRISDIRDTLVLAMLITQDAFAHWEVNLADEVFSSEYDVPVKQAIVLPTHDRLAHVARLIRSVAMAYGIRTDYALPSDEIADRLGEIQNESPAWILRLLDDTMTARTSTSLTPPR